MKKTFLLPLALSFLFALSAFAACAEPGGTTSGGTTPGGTTPGGTTPGGNEPSQTTEFTWTGLTNETIAVGDVYDPCSGITVKDTEGKDITSSLYVLTYEDNEEELTKLGVYEDYEDFNYNFAGAYLVYYGAKSGDKEEFKSREIIVEQQHNIANGDFTETTNSGGFNNWKLDLPGSVGALEKVTENGKAKPKFNITNCGNSWWGMQYMSQCNLKQGETYKITVRAKSTNGKSFAFGFEDVANNYAMLQGLTPYTATAEYADYVSYYTANKDYPSVKAVLYLGYILEADPTATYDITFDSVKIEKIEKCPNVTFTGLDKLTLNGGSDELKAFIANPKAGVTASDGTTDLTGQIAVKGEVPLNPMEDNTVTLAYVIENENGPTAIGYRTLTVKVVKENPYDIKNADFAKDISFWTPDINAESPGADGATIAWEANGENDGAMKITINDPGSGDWWRIQSYQEVTVEQGVHYVAKIRAKADRNRQLQLEIDTPQAQFNLTTEYQEFTVYYIASRSAKVRFNIQVGGGGTANKDSIIWIDSVSLTNYEAWQMANPNFDFGMKNWGSEGAQFTEGEDADGKYVQAECGVTDAAWRIQLRQDGKSFEVGKTYKVVLKIKASTARNVTVEVRKDNYGGNVAHDFAVTTEVQTLEWEFSFSQEGCTGLRAGMLLGGAPAATVTVYQFEIVEVPAK